MAAATEQAEATVAATREEAATQLAAAEASATALRQEVEEQRAAATTSLAQVAELQLALDAQSRAAAEQSGTEAEVAQAMASALEEAGEAKVALAASGQELARVKTSEEALRGDLSKAEAAVSELTAEADAVQKR